MYFAFRNKKTRKYISGTDFRYNPPHQIAADKYTPPKLFTEHQIATEIIVRKINLERYEIVPVNLIETSK